MSMQSDLDKSYKKCWCGNIAQKGKKYCGAHVPMCPYNGGDHGLQVDADEPCPVCGDYSDDRAFEQSSNCVDVDALREARNRLLVEKHAKALVAWLDENNLALPDCMETLIPVPARLLRDMRKSWED